MSRDVTATEIEKDDQNKILTDYGFLKTVSKNFSEFMSNSSIHGLKYLVGSDRAILEKSLWFTILIISIYTCSMYINSTWENWKENPTFIGVGQTPVRLWEIPFPAVTICSGYKFYRNSNYTFLDTPDWINLEEVNDSSLCQLSINSVFEIRDLFVGSKWEDYLLETAIPPGQFLKASGFSFSEISVAPFLTSDGVCYSFNMLDKNELLRNTTYIPGAFGQQKNVSNWTFDKNYFKTTEVVYPLRSRSEYDFLELELEPYIDHEGCVGYNEYYIILHHPAEIPSRRINIFIQNKKINQIILTPDITNTVDSLKNYSPARKKCFFSDERYLYYYKIYTEENCKLECLANYTLASCGCVPFYVPHEKTTKLCGAYDIVNGIYGGGPSAYCLTKARKLMLESESGLQDNDSDVPLCNCLPSCNLIIYNAEVKTSESYGNLSWVSIKYKEAEFRVWMRQDLFGGVNFWANCGGLLGLFMGFSLISVVEILYYLFFRLLYRFVRRLWDQLNLVDLYLH